MASAWAATHAAAAGAPRASTTAARTPPRCAEARARAKRWEVGGGI
jgi:hypothetical protein